MPSAGSAAIPGETGARTLLGSGAIPVRTLSLPEAAFDLDSPGDLEVFRAQGVSNR